MAAPASARSTAPQVAVPFERMVLVGFMGAGKSTVGRLVAKAMGWSFADLDREVECREGVSVPEIIRDRGLDRFREVESATGREVLRRRQMVLSVGGGWASQPGHMELLDDVTVSVWLRVKPETALARLARSPTARPLLQVADPLGAAEALLAERTPYYVRSDVRIDTEGRLPYQVARAVLDCVTAGHSPDDREPETGVAGRSCND